MAAPFIFKDDILNGKVALITGGATGLGYSMASRMAQAGADLVIASRRFENCDRAATELSKEYGVRALAKQLDVRRSEAVNQVFAEAADEMGGLDILVNNAAGNFYFPTAELSDGQWNAVIGIDLHGTFHCTRAAFPYLKERGGSIVSITMTRHYNGWVGMAPACAAKAGIDALMKTVALEWGTFGIRANCIAPGPIPTEGVVKAFRMEENGFDQVDRQIPIGRIGVPEDVADLAVFLVSDAATWITGGLYVVDGGEQCARHGNIDPERLEQIAEMTRKERGR